MLDMKFLERVDRVISQRLEELVSILCATASTSNDKRVEAAALSGSLSRELEELATIGRCRIEQAPYHQVFEVRAFQSELLQRPRLQAILVLKIKDC